MNTTRLQTHRVQIALAAGVALGIASAAFAWLLADPADVRYDPSPRPVVKRMLIMAGAGEGDTMIDAGSGDGRIPIAAARAFDVERAIGIEIDPDLVERARRFAREAGVADRTRFIRGDLFEQDYSGADFVTLFLLPDINVALRPLLLEQLDPGTPIVSHEHPMGAWPPDASATIEGEQRSHDIHLWIVPARMAGEWRPAKTSASIDHLSLDQRFQQVNGTVRIDGERFSIDEGRIRGREIHWTAREAGGEQVHFRGRLTGDALTGELVHGERPPMTITMQKTTGE